MYTFLTKLGKIIGNGRLVRIIFNYSPMYRRTGGRLVDVSNDLQYVKIKLPLNYKTRNYVGTLYGGHMYSAVDGIYMVQLINILGQEYVVWDKSATIKFKRPGNKTLYAEFTISDEFIAQVKNEINELREKDYHLHVQLRDKEDLVYAEVEKVIYIAAKEFYKEKRKKKATSIVENN
jgi:acyl-coenzyme A thioesterase PaaI-like protein